jgi:phage tail sheath protein FI
MAFSLSPGVTVSEVDLTTTVPSVATSIGAYAGNFRWGPVEEIVTINNEAQLVDRFGSPDTNTAIPFFSVANFLAYSNNIRIVRAAGATGAQRNAGNSTTILIKNEVNYANAWVAGGSAAANTTGPLVAKYPGSLGNSLTYSICDANSTVFSSWTYTSQFSSAPGTSTYVSARGGSRDEIHVIVVDRLGRFSGTPNTILEKFEYLSRATDAKKETGASNYWKDVINQSSKYLRWVSEPRQAQLSGAGASNVYSGNSTTAFANSTASLTINMAGGVDEAPATGNVVTAYGLFSNPDEVDIGLVITGDHSISSVVNNLITSLGEGRKDCIVFVSPPQTDVVDKYGSEVTNILTSRTSVTSSSYAFMDSGWKYQYDKYNDVYRWIPLNSDIAGICAKTDADKDPWFSPGGLNRGFVKNLVRLAYNPKKADRDLLYIDQVNPVVTFTGTGTVLFGDKTLLDRPSAFDRINVRRLFIILEKAIANASRYSLFEFNDAFTRSQFVNLVEPYLRDIQGRRGITDFRVVCDETNNTSEIIDRNEFVGDIYVKPARSINYIQLNFIATRTGVSFEEVVGRF